MRARPGTPLKGTAIPTFRELGVVPEICESLEAIGIVDAFPIQEMTLPVALSGNDVIGQAKTGTGKTLGFGIPLLQRVTLPGEPNALAAAGKPQALAVVPTRELAVQVAKDLQVAGKARGVRVLTVYGGRAYEPQVEALRTGVEIVVGTPGRLLDLAQQGHLDLGYVRMLVLDEADEMLDLGFLPDVERILARTPAGRQTMLFSATMPSKVVALAKVYMTQPTHINAIDPNDIDATVASTEQHVFRAHGMDKPEVLARVLQAKDHGLVMVFCRTKRAAARVADDLTERGFAAAAVHGDLGQGAREQALRAFRTGKVDVLVATDVAARGIDVTGVSHVVNYECPDDEKTYLHRIGRTGRAGSSGVAVTLVDWADVTRWQMINKALGLSFYEPAETYSSSEHLYDVLDIPAGVTGTLPRASRTRAGLGAEQVEDLGETGKARAPRGGAKPPSSARSSARSSDTGPDETKPREARPPRERTRRRTRGGGGAGEGDALTPASPVEAVVAAGTVVTDEAPTGDEAPKRTRRRGGRGRGRSTEGTSGGKGTLEDTTPPDVAVSIGSDA